MRRSFSLKPDEGVFRERESAPSDSRSVPKESDSRADDTNLISFVSRLGRGGGFVVGFADGLVDKELPIERWPLRAGLSLIPIRGEE